MNILILGAAGQIAKILTEMLLEQMDESLVLYARDAQRRLSAADPQRETLIAGDFHDAKKLSEAMKNIDVVYLNEMSDKTAVSAILTAMENAGIKRIIGVTTLGIYGEVGGAFGKWNKQMIGDMTPPYTAAAQVLEQSGMDYTLLRLSWLYNEDGNVRYMLTQKGEPFVGAQVTRQAVAQLVIDIIKDTTGKYIHKSLGVSEPDTDWDKPSFY